MLNPSVKLSDLTTQDYQRYSRHIIIDHISVEGQTRIKQSKILFIGAGGLNSSAMLYLVASGVGTIGIIDHDIVELSNLPRQIIYNTNNLQQPKVRCALKTLKSLNPLIQIKIYNQKLVQNNAKSILYNYDLVIDGTDNFESRYIISQYCYEQHKIHIYAAIEKFTGYVSVFNYQNGPNYFNLSHILNSETTNACNTIGVLNTLAGLTGIIQATEAIKIITGIGNVLSGHLLIINIINLSFNKIKIQRRSTINDNKISKKHLPNKVKYISYVEINNSISQPVILIDVRPAIEFKISQIQKAINIPLKQFKYKKTIEQIKQKSKDSMIIIYCNNEIQSKLAATILYKYNIDNYVLKKGIYHFLDQRKERDSNPC